MSRDYVSRFKDLALRPRNVALKLRIAIPDGLARLRPTRRTKLAQGGKHASHARASRHCHDIVGHDTLAAVFGWGLRRKRLPNSSKPQKRMARSTFLHVVCEPAIARCRQGRLREEIRITVDVLNVRASELEERIRTEQGAGRFLGDVIQHGRPPSRACSARASCRSMAAFPQMKNMIDGQPPEPHEIGSLITGYAIMVNSNLVKPEDEPKSWRDLLDPKWKGKILSSTLRALGGALRCSPPLWASDPWRSMASTDGDAGPVFTRDVGNSERRVARGEYPIWIPQISVNVQGLIGAARARDYPKEGRRLCAARCGMLKITPRPNAAKLFMNFYISEGIPDGSRLDGPHTRHQGRG